jgi:HK97 gp10 family phage protein
MAETTVVFNDRALTKLLAGPGGPVAQMMLDLAHDVEAVAKMMAPYRTGDLRGSIQSTVDFLPGRRVAAFIGSTLDYAGYVELGTSKMAAQPYLRPALAQVTAGLG